MATRFPIRVGRRSAPFLRLFFGVRADDAWIELDDDPAGNLEVQFGWSHFRAPLARIDRWQIEGPWLWITAIGVRTSLRYRDLTFGGNPDGGVRIDFRERVRFGPIGIRALYVTVGDLEGLGAALRERGIDGVDGRKPR